MPSKNDWPSKVVRTLIKLGEDLGFRCKKEKPLKAGAKADLVWYYPTPIGYLPSIFFEIESRTARHQRMINVAKVAPSGYSPCLIVQIHSDKLKDDEQEYLERASGSIQLRIIEGAEKMSESGELERKVMTIIRRFLVEREEPEFDLSDEKPQRKLIRQLEKATENLRMKFVNVLHVGEDSESHRKHIVRALEEAEDQIVVVRSVACNSEMFPHSLENFGLLVISDVKAPRTLKPDQLQMIAKFGEEKPIIVSGGTGLTADYNSSPLNSTLPAVISGRGRWRRDGVKPKKSSIDDEHPINRGVNWLQVTLRGYNQIKEKEGAKVLVRLEDHGDPPLLILRDKGLVFASDCSPDWGTDFIRTTEFMKLWSNVLSYFFKGSQEQGP